MLGLCCCPSFVGVRGGLGYSGLIGGAGSAFIFYFLLSFFKESFYYWHQEGHGSDEVLVHITASYSSDSLWKTYFNAVLAKLKWMTVQSGHFLTWFTPNSAPGISHGRFINEGQSMTIWATVTRYAVNSVQQKTLICLALISCFK